MHEDVFSNQKNSKAGKGIFSLICLGVFVILMKNSGGGL